MREFRRALRSHPFCSLVLLLALCVGFLCLGKPVSRLLPEGLLGEALYEVYHILWPLGLVLFFGFGRIYREGDFWETVWAGLPFFVMEGGLLASLLFLAAGDGAARWGSPASILLGTLTLFGIGFREESIFRGLVANLFGECWIRSGRDVRPVVFLSGGVFGLIHLANVFAGMSCLSAAVQSAAACAVGWALCAAYLRGGNLWCMILIHALTDSASLFDAMFFADGDLMQTLNSISLINLFPVLPFTLIAAFLLRRPYDERIAGRFRDRKESDP